MKKKTSKAFLLIIATIFMSMIVSITTFAANEVEPNDGSNYATVISTDEMHSGKLSSDEDIDWYKFVNSKDYFTISFSIGKDVNYNAVGKGWNLKIYKAGSSIPVKEYLDITENFTTDILPMEGEMYVEVTSADVAFKTDAPVGCEYNLVINIVEDKFFETEENDSSKTANEINVSKTYKGILHFYDDIDCYAVETKTGAFNISFILDKTVSLSELVCGWDLAVYKYGSTVPIVEYKNIKENMATFDMPFKGKFMIKVSGHMEGFTYDAPVNHVYNLKVNPKKSSELWENEENASKSAANKLVTDKYYNANLYNCDDIDYFKFKAPCSGAIDLVFTREVSDEVYKGWKITVLKSNGKSVFEGAVSDKTKFVKKNIKIKKDETYYLKVESNHDNFAFESPIHVNYKIGVKFKAKTDNVTNFKATPSKTSIKLTWKTVSGAEGYKIYTYNTKTKKYKLVKTTKKTTHTLKDLKSGTNYTYYIKAYQTYKDEQVLSEKYTKLATATKCSTPTLKVASAKKGIVNLSWSNVSGESGYQVYYSTKKDSGYKKVASYKVNVVKGSKKKLKSGKKYYFKVRAYKKTASGIVYSSWSAVKSVKIK